MRIIKKQKDEAGNWQVHLVSGEEDLGSVLKDVEQQAYVQDRFQNKKKIVHLNLIKEQLWLVLLDKEGELAERLENARVLAHKLLPSLNHEDAGTVCIHSPGAGPEECIAFAEGLALSSYQFLKYRTDAVEKQNSLEEILISDDRLTGKEVQKLDNLVKAVYLSRDLINEPLSYLTATRLSEEIGEMGKEAGFQVEVFNKKKIESMKMGGLLAVNKGSIDPPTFSILSYKPENALNSRPMVLVGKGVVYDTGGLSLKPTKDSMDYMKCDMGGAAAVAGAMYAVASNKLPLWVIALIPATDNRPDGNAYVPGDIVTMHDGTTVEVMNTDAEGRMILADGLSYAKKYNPELVIELSTLTGSAEAAVDKFAIVAMGNAGKESMGQLVESGAYTCERIAEFPFWDDYKEQLTSGIADLKNLGGRLGGAIVAGKFLEHFTDYPYIHLDIAGPSWNKIPFNYRGQGGSAVGVRILYNYFLSKSK